MKWALYLITSVTAFLFPLSALAEDQPSAAIFADRPEVFAGEPIRVTTILTNPTSKELIVMLDGRSYTTLRIRAPGGIAIWERRLIDSPLSNADVTYVESHSRLVVEVAACCVRTGRRPGDLAPLVLPAGRYQIEIAYHVRGTAELTARTEFVVVALPEALAAAHKEISSPEVLAFLSDGYMSLRPALDVLKRVAGDRRTGVLADQANYVMGSYLLARTERLDEQAATAAIEYFLAVSDGSPALKARSNLRLVDAVERSEFVLPLKMCADIEAGVTLARLAYPWLRTDQEWQSSLHVLARRRAVAENNVEACIALTQERFGLFELSTMLGQMRGRVDPGLPKRLVSAIEKGSPNVAILSAFALARTGLDSEVGVGFLTFAAQSPDKHAASSAMYALRELARRNVDGAAEAVEGLR